MRASAGAGLACLGDMDGLALIRSASAPGAPGAPPLWTTGAKAGVGCSLSTISRCWFTLAQGIVTEIYYPRLDMPATRDMGFIVTDGQEFFSEEKRQAEHALAYEQTGVPAYHLSNMCREGRYRIEKWIIADPERHELLQRVRFTPLRGRLQDYRLYALLNPHLDNQGSDNTAWVGDYTGRPMLFAEHMGSALAMACSAPWLKRSAGYVGTSDGWQDLVQHRQMLWEYERAEHGNVALTGEIDLQACKGEFLLLIAFGRHPSEAGERVGMSLLDGQDRAWRKYIDEWSQWQSGIQPLDVRRTVSTTPSNEIDVYRTSTMVLRAHESLDFPGGIIASLAIPWGEAHGDKDAGGYHMVWSRDLAEAAGGLLAAGAHADARRAIRFLEVIQQPDGHWPQNAWLDGTPHWRGVQLDETALPLLLIELAAREHAIGEDDLRQLWPTVRRAAGFLVRNGPATQEDRWENKSGYSTFTIAASVAALLVAAEMADGAGESEVGEYLRQTADVWNASMEYWTYVRGTDLARRANVGGYYMRIAPTEGEANRGDDAVERGPADSISPDALALVRFGLRPADDPRIRNTIAVIDTMLKTETPAGPAWHRYDQDHYGEGPDGSPHTGYGAGRGRLWPLLTGERAHYELAAGQIDEAARLARTMAAFSNDGGMIPEQVWDAPNIPEKGLFFGRPSGSAMPLVWAHAEYVKLLRSLHDGRIFDMPRQAWQRYQKNKVTTDRVLWRFNSRRSRIPTGKVLRVEVMAPAVIHYTLDGWRTAHDASAHATDLGVWWADLPTGKLRSGGCVMFTMFWPQVQRWEGADFMVEVDGSR